MIGKIEGFIRDVNQMLHSPQIVVLHTLVMWSGTETIRCPVKQLALNKYFDNFEWMQMNEEYIEVEVVL